MMNSSSEYLDILKIGLPITPKKRIGIVGAGITGLVAASLLAQAGHDVFILEARNRPGGRIYTYRDLPDNMYAELGAMRWPKSHKLIHYLIHERFHLETKNYASNNNNTFIHLFGKKYRNNEFTLNDLPILINKSDRDKTPQEILNKFIEPLFATIQNEGWWALINKYDKYSLLGYLEERNLSQDLLSVLGILFNFEGRLHFSLVEWFAQHYDDVFSDLEYIVEGADRLPRSYEKELGECIRYGAQVYAVDQTPKSVEIHYRTINKESFSVKADACILTIPLSLIRHLRIEGMDIAKQYEIRTCYYGRAHKIFLQFSERWWKDLYDIDYGTTITDMAIRNVIYTPAGQGYSKKRGIILGSYCWEQDSMPFSPLSETDRLTRAVEDLSKIHPEAIDTFEYGVTYDWALDPYACGIGPLFRPYEMSGLRYLDLIRPIGNIWIANDGTDRRHRRWAEGSVRSAIRNAYCIVTNTPIETWLKSQED